MSASTAASAGVAVWVRGVTKRYGPIPALNDVTLTVRSGELVAVVGENGAGKSTLVRCVAGDVEPDAGTVTIGPSSGDEPVSARDASVAVVWEDLGLCEDLDVVANIFLGREPGRLLLAESRMLEEARSVIERVGADLPDLRVRVDTLSRGQRQQVAIARALVTGRSVVVLDEPTASLSLVQRARVTSLLRRLRDQGHALLLVSHDLDEVFALADRIVVLRHGRVVATASPRELHPDDVGALMSGIETESAARRQLRRLRSLVEQLSSASPPASLPIIVSAAAAALDQESLCLHLRHEGEGGPVLRQSAAVGLPVPVRDALAVLPVGSAGASMGLAAELGELVVVDDIRDDDGWAPYAEVASAHGLRSAWSAPIVGSGGVLGVISGLSDAVGPLAADRVELASLYAGHAAAAIEREHLFEEVSRRNRVLESLRAMLETLAGPDRVDGGLSVALLALCRGLGADAVAVHVDDGDAPRRWSFIAPGGGDEDQLARLADLDQAAVSEGSAPHVVGRGFARAGLPLPHGSGVLVAQWRESAAPDADALELLDDARRSLALALEREGLERARGEASAARRSQALQRELLLRLSHELRTPLTAIRGYASTLQQPDLTWDAESTERFLAAIAGESARMERLVGDLLDSSAIESGLLELRRDWTDLRLVLEAASACVGRGDRVRLDVEAELEPIWADHDRLEQVFVNLLENAARHGDPTHPIEVVAARRNADPRMVEVLVRDHGQGVPADVAGRIFEPRVRGDSASAGAGLGLAIARGIAEAHGGACELLPAEHTTFRVTLPIEPDGDARGIDVDRAIWDLVEDTGGGGGG